MKFNPFRPGNIVGPGMFVGRMEEMDSIEQCLFQTKHGNPHHFLIEGERGIGKSSLLFLAEPIAAGRVPASDKSNMRFLTVSIDLGGVKSQLDIVRAIGRRLREALAEREPIKEKASKVWDFLQKWEVMGVRYHADTTSDAEDARDELVNKLVELCEATKEDLEGVFVLIDEAAHQIVRGVDQCNTFSEREIGRGRAGSVQPGR